MIKEIMEFLSGRKMTALSAAFLLLSLGLMVYDILPPIEPVWGTILISGTPIVYKALKRLLFCRCVSSPLLITVAMIAAIFIGELFAAGEVALIMAIGELLEDATVDKAKRGLSRLLELTPTAARKIFKDGCDKLLPLAEIKKDDILRILPGETIPVDGIITKGSTSVNQSSLTGESLPVDKTIGDKVMAGTTNCFGMIEIKVHSIKDTYLRRMINLVKEAENKKAPTERIVDKWAAILVPAALILAILTYIITNEVIRAVTVLVVFCPCALVLATPTSVMAAIGQAAKRGVLIKSGAALEEMGQANTAVFDKTGTLTAGNVKVSDIIPLKAASRNEVLSLCAGLEKYSEHTLAKAVVKQACAENMEISQIKEFSMVPGKGVSGIFDNKKALAGNLLFCQENGIYLNDVSLKKIKELQQQEKAVIIVCYADKAYGIIGLSDTLRPQSPEMIRNLRNMGVETLVLTGDNKIAAKHFAKLAGISEIHADLLPEAKVKKIKSLIRNGHHVCMTGDGINDAAALKAANVGIAMGSVGSDIAIDATDIVLINDNIESIPYLKKLALLTVRTIKINISISMFLNFLGIALSMLGILTPITGAIMHNLGSVLVVLNAASLYDKKL